MEPGLFRFLMVNLFFSLSFSETHQQSATKYCTIIGSCCGFDQLTFDFRFPLLPPPKILRATNCAKFGMFLSPSPSHVVLYAVKFLANKRLSVKLRCFPCDTNVNNLLSSRTFCSTESSSRKFYAAYHVCCSAKRCSLTN